MRKKGELNELHEGFDSWTQAQRNLWCDDFIDPNEVTEGSEGDKPWDEEESGPVDGPLEDPEFMDGDAPPEGEPNMQQNLNRKLSIGERLTEIANHVIGNAPAGAEYPGRRRLGQMTPVARKLCGCWWWWRRSCTSLSVGYYISGGRYCSGCWRAAGCYGCGAGLTSAGR